MRTLITLLLLSALLLLSGCATTGEAAFYARQEAAESARAAQMASLADTSACNGDPTCVVAAKGFAAMAFASGGGNAQPQQYVPQPSTAARVGLALIGQLSPLASAAVAWRSSDNSVRTAEAQFGFLGGVVDSVSTASARSNEAAFGVLPQLGPRIDVGGDYVPGQIGDNAGRDIVRDGSQVGHNTGAINTGTQIENDGNFGDGNRQNSPDDRSQRTECEGDGCMGVNRPITNPLPEPEDEG
jgi:hypothetical protein